MIQIQYGRVFSCAFPFFYETFHGMTRFNENSHLPAQRRLILWMDKSTSSQEFNQRIVRYILMSITLLHQQINILSHFINRKTFRTGSHSIEFHHSVCWMKIQANPSLSNYSLYESLGFVRICQYFNIKPLPLPHPRVKECVPTFAANFPWICWYTWYVLISQPYFDISLPKGCPQFAEHITDIPQYSTIDSLEKGNEAPQLFNEA